MLRIAIFFFICTLIFFGVSQSPQLGIDPNWVRYSQIILMMATAISILLGLSMPKDPEIHTLPGRRIV